MCLLSVSTFYPNTALLNALKVVFWLVFLIIWVCSQHISLLIEPAGCNLVCRFSKSSRFAFWGFQIFTSISSSASPSPNSRIFFILRKLGSKMNPLRWFFPFNESMVNSGMTYLISISIFADLNYTFGSVILFFIFIFWPYVLPPLLKYQFISYQRTWVIDYLNKTRAEYRRTRKARQKYATSVKSAKVFLRLHHYRELFGNCVVNAFACFTRRHHLPRWFMLLNWIVWKINNLCFRFSLPFSPTPVALITFQLVYGFIVSDTSCWRLSFLERSYT